METNELIIQFKKELSNLLVNREINHEISKFIKGFIAKNKNDIDNQYEIKEIIESELFLFDFKYSPKKSIYSDVRNNSTPLVPYFIDKDGNSYHDLKNFDNKQTEYFLKRFHEETNCYLKIIYAEYLLLKSTKSQIDRRELFKSLMYSLMNMIDTVIIQKEEYYELDVSLYLSRLIEIICIKNILPEDEVNKANDLILKIFSNYLREENYRFILDIIEYLIVFELIPLLKIIYDDLISSYNKAINDFRIKKQFNFARDYHEKIFKINKLLGKQNFDINLKKGEEFEIEASKKIEEENYFAAVYFYELAILEYQKISPFPHEKIDSIDQILKNNSQNLKKEFKEIGGEFKVNFDEAYKDYLEYYLINKDKENNIEGYFFSDDTRFPSYKLFLDQFEKTVKNSFHSLFPQFLLDEDRTIAKPTSDEENSEIQKISFYRIHFQVNTQALFYLFFKLKEMDVINFNKIKDYISKANYINSYHKTGLVKSIEAFDNKDYFTCLHLAVTLFESILRHRLNIQGLRIKKYDKTKTEYLLLSELIKDEVWQENNLLSENYTYFINFLLNERGGINLRNKIAHGFVKEEELNEGLSIIVLFSLLHLVYKFQ